MRRSISNALSLKVLVFLVLAALFNLISYSLDQLIVQSEDKLRKQNSDLQIIKLKVSDFSSTINIFQNIYFEVSHETNLLRNLWGFNAKTYDLFDMQSKGYFDHQGKITDEKLLKNSKELSIFYEKKLYELIEKLNFKTIQFNIIFKENFSTGETFKILKNNQTFLNYLKKPIFEIDKNLVKEMILLDDEKAYEKFLIVLDYTDLLYKLRDDIEFFDQTIQKEYLNSIAEYFEALNNYSKINNKNNYLILSSICSQIIGLFFLLLLFRTLIKENY